jgi:hypothetical protein
MTEAEKQKLIASLKDIKDYESFSLPESFVYLLIAFVLVVLAILYYVLVHRKKDKYEGLDIYAETKLRLKELDPVKATSSEFYLEHARILRGYLSVRTKPKAASMTGTELKNFLFAYDFIPASELEKLKNCFSRAELAKFARTEHESKLKQQDLDFALTFVELIENDYRASQQPDDKLTGKSAGTNSNKNKASTNKIATEKKFVTGKSSVQEAVSINRSEVATIESESELSQDSSLKPATKANKKKKKNKKSKDKKAGKPVKTSQEDNELKDKKEPNS